MSDFIGHHGDDHKGSIDDDKEEAEGIDGRCSETLGDSQCWAAKAGVQSPLCASDFSARIRQHFLHLATQNSLGFLDGPSFASSIVAPPCPPNAARPTAPANLRVPVLARTVSAGAPKPARQISVSAAQQATVRLRCGLLFNLQLRAASALGFNESNYVAARGKNGEHPQLPRAH
jgi:hypothetical protein